jgi:hypothetical protein
MARRSSVSAQACVCVCVRAHAFARVRMHAHVRACERVECVREHAYVSVQACVHVHACVLLSERWTPGSQPADSESHYVMRGVGVCIGRISRYPPENELLFWFTGSVWGPEPPTT